MKANSFANVLREMIAKDKFFMPCIVVQATIVLLYSYTLIEGTATAWARSDENALAGNGLQLFYEALHGVLNVNAASNSFSLYW